MAKYDDNDGVWRTIGGRRVFIKKGQNLSDAMKESGKFKIANKKTESKSNRSAKDMNDELRRKEDAYLSSYKGESKLEKERNEIKKLHDELKNQAKKEGYDITKTNWRDDIQDKNNEFELPENWKHNRELNWTDKNEYNKIDDALQKKVKDLQEKSKELEPYSDEKMALQKKIVDAQEDIIYARQRHEREQNRKEESDIKHAGWELYSDDPHRYDDEISSREARKEKYKATKHIGFGDYNDDDIPVYKNDIDYTGNFSNANLKNMTDNDLIKALNVQSEEYKKATSEKLGDQRTRNGRMDKIFNTQKVQQYEAGMNKLNEEINKRDLPRYNIYDKKNPDVILVSSPTKELAEKQIQDMYRTDMKLKKTYNWQDAPQYDFRVGKVDEYLNERKESSLQSRYSGTMDYLKTETNLSNEQIMKLLKKLDEDKKRN